MDVSSGLKVALTYTLLGSKYINKALTIYNFLINEFPNDFRPLCNLSSLLYKQYCSLPGKTKTLVIYDL